jgi:hypothetical protein
VKCPKINNGRLEYYDLKYNVVSFSMFDRLTSLAEKKIWIVLKFSVVVLLPHVLLILM